MTVPQPTDSGYRRKALSPTRHQTQLAYQTSGSFQCFYLWESATPCLLLRNKGTSREIRTTSDEKLGSRFFFALVQELFLA